MKKVFRSITLVFCLVLGMQFLSFCQTSGDSANHTVQTRTEEHEDHGNWGLVGLLGLIGLAGLRNPNVVNRKVEYTNPQNR